MENIDYKYSRESDDYLEPDIIICCDRNEIRGNVKRDRGIKKDIFVF